MIVANIDNIDIYRHN